MRSHTQTFYTSNTKLAAALATLGFPLRKKDPITRLNSGGRDTVNYWFGVTSESGQFQLRQKKGWGILDAWEHRERFEAECPEHPLCYIRAVLENRERLLDLINKAAPLVLIEKGSHSILVHRDAKPETLRKLQEIL